LNSGIIDAFTEAMRSGIKTVSDGTDAIHAMKAVFGALRSAEKRETVVL
jgi:hypothetical protein